MRSLNLAILLAASACFAQDAPASRPPGGNSVGLGVHSQGLMINFVHTGQNRFGFFLGYAGTSREDKDLPAEANFSWITYNNEEWKSKNAYHAGVAFRVSPNLQLGLGYGGKSTEYYNWGYGVSGIPFRSTASHTKSESGVVGILDFGQPRGFGGQIIGGTNGFGGAVAFRF